MGRASNRKWAARRERVWNSLKSPFASEKTEGIRLLSLFGQHRQFLKYFVVRRTRAGAAQ